MFITILLTRGQSHSRYNMSKISEHMVWYWFLRIQLLEWCTAFLITDLEAISNKCVSVVHLGNASYQQQVKLQVFIQLYS